MAQLRAHGRWPAARRRYRTAASRPGAATSMVRRTYRLFHGGRLHASTGGYRLAEFPHASHAGELRVLPPLAALARTGPVSRASISRLRARHPLEPVADAVGHHGHQHAAHLLASQASPGPGPAWRVRAPLGAGIWQRRLPEAHRGRTCRFGRRQGKTLWSSQDPRGAPGGRQHSAQAWLPQERPTPKRHQSPSLEAGG